MGGGGGGLVPESRSWNSLCLSACVCVRVCVCVCLSLSLSLSLYLNTVQVQIVARFVIPGHATNPLQVIGDHTVLRLLRLHTFEPTQLLFRRLARSRGGRSVGEFPLEFSNLDERMRVSSWT